MREVDIEAIAITRFQELERNLGYSDELQKGLRANTGCTERVQRLSSALRSARPGKLRPKTITLAPFALNEDEKLEEEVWQDA